MLTYAQFIARTAQYVQDAAYGFYTAPEFGYLIEDGIKRVSEFDPHIIEATYQVESRTGADTAGTASSLTDATKSQFLAADATLEKVIHNITDDTWAVVKTYTSTSVLVLTKDIMDINENYEIYNKRCRNKRQIYLGDSVPYLWVDSVEYPVGTERNFKQISRDIIEIDVDTVEDSNSTLTTLNSVDVLIRFAVPQALCQLADLAGAVHTTAAAGASSMQVKSFTDAQVIEVGDLFNIADHRTTYVVTTQVTLANQATTGSTLAFYPALEAGATADDVITFVGSTLRPQHERILRSFVAGEAVCSKSSQALQGIVTAITTLDSASDMVDAMTAEIDKAITATTGDMALGKIEIAKAVALITTTANGEIAKITTEVAQALADLDTGRIIINTVPKGGTQVPSDYANYAAGDVNNARGFLTSAQGYLQQAQADEQLGSSYLRLAATDLAAAGSLLNQSTGYLREVNAAITLAKSARPYREWGEREIARAENEMRSLVRPRVAKKFSTS